MSKNFKALWESEDSFFHWLCRVWRSWRKPEVVLKRSFPHFVLLVWNKLAIALDCSFLFRLHVLYFPRRTNLQRHFSLTNIIICNAHSSGNLWTQIYCLQGHSPLRAFTTLCASVARVRIIDLVNSSSHWHHKAWSININININICSIELKWDGKLTKIWYDNKMRWIRITVWNGGVL